MGNKELKEAAEKFYSEQSESYENAIEPTFDDSRYLVTGFIDGVKSDAARDYWFEKFKLEQEKNNYSEEELLSFGKLVLDTFHSEGRTTSGKQRLARIKYPKWFDKYKKK